MNSMRELGGRCGRVKMLGVLGVMAVLWVGGGRLVRWGWGLCACTGG